MAPTRKAGRRVLAAAALYAMVDFSRGPSTFVPWGGARAPRNAEVDTLDAQSGADVAAPTSRRDAAALLLGGVAPLFAGASSSRAEIDLTQWDTKGPRSTPDPRPKPPSRFKWIRDLQQLSWKNEPYRRMTMYLETAGFKIDSSFWNPKYYVHWSQEGPEQYKFDVLNSKSFTEAKDQGRLLTDTLVSSKSRDIKVYIYASDKDRAWVQEHLPIDDNIFIPQEWQENIEYVRNTPFPTWDGPEYSEEELNKTVPNYFAPDLSQFISETNKENWKKWGLWKTDDADKDN